MLVVGASWIVNPRQKLTVWPTRKTVTVRSVPASIAPFDRDHDRPFQLEDNDQAQSNYQHNSKKILGNWANGSLQAASLTPITLH